MLFTTLTSSSHPSNTNHIPQFTFTGWEECLKQMTLGEKLKVT